MTKAQILKIAKLYDVLYRGGTYRGMIDEELAKVLAWASKLPKMPSDKQIERIINKL